MIERIPFAVALLTMVGGVAIAILFGINEEIFKGKIQHQLQSNPKVLSLEGEERAAYVKKEAAKNWRYYQRFHFHSTGIGAMALSVLLLLGGLGGPAKLKLAAAYCTSVGGFLYPYVWLFAALYGPEIGRSAAKARFEIFGYMGGVFLIGLGLTLFLLLRYPPHQRLVGPR